MDFIFFFCVCSRLNKYRSLANVVKLLLCSGEFWFYSSEQNQGLDRPVDKSNCSMRETMPRKESKSALDVLMRDWLHSLLGDGEHLTKLRP